MNNELVYVDTITIDVFYDRANDRLVWRKKGQWYYKTELTEMRSDTERLESAFRDNT